MSKKTVLLIGPPGSGKTVVLETLPGGTILLNFDPAGWQSLERPPISEVEAQLIRAGKKHGRIPKKLKFAKTVREWLTTTDELAPDEILAIDYAPRIMEIKLGKQTTFSTETFLESSQDINQLMKMKANDRGICHVAVDSLSGWQWAILEAIVVFRGSTQGGYIGTDQNVYGLAIEKVREVIDTCCHLPFDFILTAHIQSDKDDVIGKIKEEISIYGKKLPELLASMISDIYLCGLSTVAGVPTAVWSSHSEQFLKVMRTRSFDNLPNSYEANFSKRYGEGGLIHPIKKEVI
jgi:hypothetical protein